ncbi:MAG: hypothetical protein U5R06_08190 [candidate division KSB1 bacterium]|nr:hypothetical protein [candidate division KSB1 bacterium]
MIKYFKYGFLLPPLLLSLFFIYCSLERPQAPSWTVDLIIPLSTKTYEMKEIAQDNNNLYITQGNHVYLNAQQKLDTVAVGERLALEDREKSNSLVPPPAPLSEITFQDSILLTDHILVETATFRTGVLQLEFENNTQSEINVLIEFPSLKLASENESFTLETTVPSRSATDRVIERISLNGATFTPGIMGQKNTVYYRTTLTFKDNLITNKTIATRIKLTNLVLDYFRGRFNSFTLPMTSPNYKMNLPEELDGIQIAQTTGTVHLYNPIENVPVTIQGFLYAFRRKTIADSMRIELRCEHPGWNSFPIENIETLLNTYPDSMQLSGKILIGTPYAGTVTEINYSDLYYGKLLIDTDIAFEIPSDLENRTDVDTLEIENDLSDAIDNNLKHAAFIVQVENHFPIGTEIELIFSNRRSDSTLSYRYSSFRCGSDPEAAGSPAFKRPRSCNCHCTGNPYNGIESFKRRSLATYLACGLYGNHL